MGVEQDRDKDSPLDHPQDHFADDRHHRRQRLRDPIPRSQGREGHGGDIHREDKVVGSDRLQILRRELGVEVEEVKGVEEPVDRGVEEDRDHRHLQVEKNHVQQGDMKVPLGVAEDVDRRIQQQQARQHDVEDIEKHNHIPMSQKPLFVVGKRPDLGQQRQQNQRKDQKSDVLVLDIAVLSGDESV